MKKCCTCERVKSTLDFYKSSQTKDGLRRQCKQCISEYGKRYRVKYKETKKKRDQEYYLKNKDYIDKRNKEWADSNRDKINKRLKEWRKRSDSQKQANVNYRGRKISQSLGEKVDLNRILERDGFVCHICKEEIKENEKLEFDHIEPLFLGGVHGEGNISPSHMHCNRSKGHKTMQEMDAKSST